jgi:CS domain
VIVSIFAKKVDKDRASVNFLEKQLDVDLPMPGNKRYKVSFPLYASIDPTGCEYKILTTKIELKLKKGERFHTFLPRHPQRLSLDADIMDQRMGHLGQPCEATRLLEKLFRLGSLQLHSQAQYVEFKSANK